MSNYPNFIAIDYIEAHSSLIPTSIAWSLEDGQVKHTIICPVDDWADTLYDAPSIDISTLMEQGASVKEVLYELNADIDCGTLYCFDSYCDEQSLESLFEACNSELAYELAPWQQSLPDANQGSLYDAAQWQAEQHGLDTGLAEDRVKMMLFTFNEMSQK